MAVSKDTVTYVPRVLHFSAFHYNLSTYLQYPNSGKEVGHGLPVIEPLAGVSEEVYHSIHELPGLPCTPGDEALW